MVENAILSAALMRRARPACRIDIRSFSEGSPLNAAIALGDGFFLPPNIRFIAIFWNASIVFSDLLGILGRQLVHIPTLIWSRAFMIAVNLADRAFEFVMNDKC